jgi:hypothetical protein
MLKADRRERLRQYNLNHDLSNPCWIICTRDIPLDPPPPPEKVPVWKTIRQRKKYVLPSAEPICKIFQKLKYNFLLHFFLFLIEIFIDSDPPKPDQWIEIKSPYIDLKPNPQPLPSIVPTVRSTSRFSRVTKSRLEGHVDGIDEKEENIEDLEGIPVENNNQINNTEADVNNDVNKTSAESELIDSTKNKNRSNVAGAKSAATNETASVSTAKNTAAITLLKKEKTNDVLDLKQNGNRKELNRV